MSARSDTGKLSAMRRVIVVLGMHRSGTSAITRGLASFGVELGDNLLPPVPGDNDKGYWEDKDVHDLNEELLTALNRDWASLRPIDSTEFARPAMGPLRLRAVDLLRSRFEKARVFGIKNPRMALLLPFWKSVFEHVGVVPSYVIAVRNPLSVARSVARNNLRGDIPPEKAHYLWLTHVVPCVVETENAPRVFVDFDRLLANPVEEMQRVGKALGLGRGKPAELEEYRSQFLDRSLRHSEFQLEDLKLARELPREVVGAYRILERLSRDRLAHDAKEVRDFFTALGARLEDLRPAFDCITDRERKLKELAAAIAQSGEQIDSLTAAIAEREARIHTLNQGLAERDGQIIRLSQAVVDREAQVEALSSAATERDARLESLVQERADIQASVQRLHESIAQRDAAIAEREAQITLLNEAIVDGRRNVLNHEQAERDRQIVVLNQAVADRDARIRELQRSASEGDALLQDARQCALERDADLIRLEQTLAERNSRIEELQRTLAERQRVIVELHRGQAERDARLEELKRSLAATRQLADERSARIVWLGNELRDRSALSERLQSALAERQARVTSLQQAVDAQHHAVASLTGAVAQRDAELGRLAGIIGATQQQVDAYRAQFEKVVTSKSWRLTQPIREFLDLGLGAGAAVRRLARKLRPAIQPPPAPPAPPPVPAPVAEQPQRAAAPPAPAQEAAPARPPAVPLVPALEEAKRALLADAHDRFRGRGAEIEEAAESDPTISILVPVYKVRVDLLRAAAESVLGQTYPKWELCLVDDCSESAAITAELERLARLDDRIKVRALARNKGISGATNEALDMATGEFVALLDNDDILTCDALACVAAEIRREPDVDVLYSDECKVDEHGNPSEVFSKPDWSPLLMLNCMYIGHLTTYRRSMVLEVGGFRSRFDFSQDYDLALRVTERTDRIVHIERIIYGWRMIPSSAASGGKPEARRSNVAALQDALDRRGWDGTVTPLPTANRVVFDASELDATVSIVVPSDNSDNILATISTITEHSTYQNYEIVVVTNSAIIAAMKGRQLDSRVRFSPYDKPYNFSDKCNVGAKASGGEFIVFFNDDVRVRTAEWIEGLLEYLRLEGVGIVGPKLLYENGTIQHAGMVSGVRTLVGTAFHCLPADTTVHYNFAQSVREVSLICGACLAMRRSVFDAIGGFDAVNVPISHSDVDLCFKVREAGLRCVYTPHACLLHIGHMSLREVKKTATAFRKDKVDIFLLRRWAHMLARDPYFTETMRSTLYHDSPEPFALFAPARQRPRAGKDILLVSHDLSESGAPRVLLEVAKVLSGAGHFVVVLSPSDGPVRLEYVDLGIPVIVDSRALEGGDGFANMARHFDKVICNTVVTWRNVARLGPEVDSFWYIHEVELLNHLANLDPGLWQAVRGVKHLLAGSDRVRKAVSDHRSDVTVLEYSVEVPRVPPQSQARRDDRTRIVCGTFASYEPRKGQDLLIKSVAELPPEAASAFELRFYGRVLDKHFFASLEEISADHPGIRLYGDITINEYFEAMRECDLIIVPSRDDTLPLVSLHALGFGKPLVCTMTTGTSKYLKHMTSGILIAANTPSAIAQVLLDALAMRDKWRDIGAAGKRVFDQHFTFERFRARLLDVVMANEMPARRETTSVH